MIAWKHLRALCLVLLLLPVLHLAYLASRDMLATLNPSPDAWDDELEDYERQDQASTLPANPILVVGGHRVKLWHGLAAMLAPQPLLMRGLGNATVDDINYHYERLIGYYRPRALVFLPGDSEFHIRNTKDADELTRGIQELVSNDAAHEATDHVYIFSPLSTPLHPEDRAKVEETTRLLRDWAKQIPRVTILDANTLLCDSAGNPDPAYFRFDGVNLNEQGYLRLSMLLKFTLERNSGTELSG